MELYRALGSLIEPPAPEHVRLARALGLPAVPAEEEHAAVVAFQRHAYASVHLGGEGMIGGEVRDRVEGFRRALGLEEGGHAGAETAGAGRPPGAGVAPDHLAALLSHRPATASRGGLGVAVAPDHLAALLSHLALIETWRRGEADPARQALLSQARDTLAWEYVLSWTPPYLASFHGCGSPFYEAWAVLLRRALDALCDEIEPPARLPEALRTAPGFPDMREAGVDEIVSAVLAPARAGMIVLRDDLVRLARTTGAAARATDRRTWLRGLLEQAPQETVGWLAGRARRWAGRMEGARPRRVAQWWSGRAARAAEALERAEADAEASLDRRRGPSRRRSASTAAAGPADATAAAGAEAARAAPTAAPTAAPGAEACAAMAGAPDTEAAASAARAEVAAR